MSCMNKINYVYWIHNEDCENHLEHGYIGVSHNLKQRLGEHKRKTKKIPTEKELFIIILFEGSREECYIKEGELRPSQNIGWNTKAGGGQGFTQIRSILKDNKNGQVGLQISEDCERSLNLE